MSQDHPNETSLRRVTKSDASRLLQVSLSTTHSAGISAQAIGSCLATPAPFSAYVKYGVSPGLGRCGVHPGLRRWSWDGPARHFHKMLKAGR